MGKGSGGTLALPSGYAAGSVKVIEAGKTGSAAVHRLQVVGQGTATPRAIVPKSIKGRVRVSTSD